MKQMRVSFHFFEHSTHAFRFAIPLEKASNAEICLLDVVEGPFLHGAVLMPASSFEAENLQDIRKNPELKFF